MVIEQFLPGDMRAFCTIELLPPPPTPTPPLLLLLLLIMMLFMFLQLAEDAADECGAGERPLREGEGGSVL